MQPGVDPGTEQVGVQPVQFSMLLASQLHPLELEEVEPEEPPVEVAQE